MKFKTDHEKLMEARQENIQIMRHYRVLLRKGQGLPYYKGYEKALDDVEEIVHDIIIKYNSENLGDDNFEEDWIHAPKILKEIKELRG